MAFASGGFHGLRYVKETTFGVTPTKPQMKNLRHTSCSLILSKDSFQSQELRSDAQITDLRHGNKRAQGDIGIELSFGEFDDFLAAAVRGAWADDAQNAGNKYLLAGTEMSSFTIERVFTDIQQYEVFTGCEIDTLSLTIQTNAMVTGTLSIVGKDVNFSTTPLDAEPDASLSGAPFDGFSGELWEGGEKIAVVTSVELNISNSLDPAFVIGSDAAAAITPGRINITGTISAFFENTDLLHKFVAEEESSIRLVIGTGTERSYIITLPRIKYSGGDNPVDGEGPITLSMPFQALYDSCSKTNIRIDRIPGEEVSPCALVYGDSIMQVSGAESSSNKIEVRLTGGNGKKTFNGHVGSEIPGIRIDNLPEGTSAKIIKTSSTTAEIQLITKGRTAPLSDENLSFSFTGASFAFGFCHCPGEKIEGLTQTFAINPSA